MGILAPAQTRHARVPFPGRYRLDINPTLDKLVSLPFTVITFLPIHNAHFTPSGIAIHRSVAKVTKRSAVVRRGGTLYSFGAGALISSASPSSFSRSLSLAPSGLGALGRGWGWWRGIYPLVVRSFGFGPALWLRQRWPHPHSLLGRLALDAAGLGPRYVVARIITRLVELSSTIANFLFP